MTISMYGASVPVLSETLKNLGHVLAIAPRQEPWGQRHFAIVDPNGILVDFNKMEPFAAPEAA